MTIVILDRVNGMRDTGRTWRCRMSVFTKFRRHDPWWEVDGPAARRARRRQRLVSGAAFAASLAAVAAAGFAWSIQLGIAAAFGVRAGLPIG
jgi:hypothetical protein